MPILPGAIVSTGHDGYWYFKDANGNEVARTINIQPLIDDGFLIEYTPEAGVQSSQLQIIRKRVFINADIVAHFTVYGEGKKQDFCINGVYKLTDEDINNIKSYITSKCEVVYQERKWAPDKVVYSTKIHQLNSI